MHINKRFYLWLLVFIASIVGISFYGGSISYSFFYLCTLIPIISILYLVRIFLKFKVYQKTEGRNLVVDSPSPFYFNLQNEDIFSYSGIQILYYSSLSTIIDLEDGAEYELFPKDGIDKKTTLICKYRGEYQVGIKNVIIQDFFKLFKFTYKNPSQLSVIVYPNIVMLDELKSVDISLIVARESILNEVEPDVIVRKYENNDGMRKINWKLSAKYGEFMVRKTIGEEKHGIGIVMSGKRYTDERLEFLPLENKLIEINIALCMYFVQKNTPVKTFLFNSSVIEDYANNMGDFEKYYETLAKYNFNSSYDDESFFGKLSLNNSVISNRIVFLILHEWTKEAIAFAELLNKNNVSVVAYIVTDGEVVIDEEKVRTSVIRIGINDNLEEVL